MTLESELRADLEYLRRERNRERTARDRAEADRDAVTRERNELLEELRRARAAVDDPESIRVALLYLEQATNRINRAHRLLSDTD